jgi:hypothetical protein
MGMGETPAGWAALEVDFEIDLELYFELEGEIITLRGLLVERSRSLRSDF